MRRAVCQAEEKVISYSQSVIFNWKYVSVIPEDIFFERASKVKNALLLSLGSFCLVGLCISFYFADRYYSPVDKLVCFIRDNMKKPIGGNEDEYLFIQRVLAGTVREKEEILKNRNRQIGHLRNDFMVSLLEGKWQSPAIDEMKAIST
jgi:hypothetical protein